MIDRIQSHANRIAPDTVGAELSCLGCGLVREPSTWDETSHAYLCVECVGAIRFRSDPDLMAQHLSSYFTGIVIPAANEWDDSMRWAENRTGAIVQEASDYGRFAWSDSLRGRVEELCEQLVMRVAGLHERPDRTAVEAIHDLAEQGRKYAQRLDSVAARLAALRDEGETTGVFWDEDAHIVPRPAGDRP